jgi:Holin of 3TMs, for gene-transfer release
MNIAADAVKGLAEGIIGGLDKIFTSDDERNKAKIELTKVLQEPHILQAMTNIEEAKHPSVFVAGWRPAIGWICAVGLSYHFLIYPFAGMVAYFVDQSLQLPALLSAGELMTLVLSLLGLGGLRTIEKTQGVSREKL